MDDIYFLLSEIFLLYLVMINMLYAITSMLYLLGEDNSRSNYL